MPKLPPALRKKLLAAILSGASLLGITATYTGYWEGKVNTTYLDPVKIPTICYGHTGPDVKSGMYKTDAECLALLEKDLGSAFQAIDRYVTAPLTDGQRVALASFIYNVGVGKFRKSTLLKLINAGKMPASCKEYPRWIRAGGEVLPGLRDRRNADEWLCTFDLPKAD